MNHAVLFLFGGFIKQQLPGLIRTFLPIVLKKLEELDVAVDSIDIDEDALVDEFVAKLAKRLGI